MRVAVITPYHRESPAWIERCVASVRAQTHACTHLLVADGHAQDWIDDAGVRHLRLDRSHADYGNTPRSLGAQLMVAEQFDAIAFLDADNWYAPDHIARCVASAEASGADFVFSDRVFVREDGSPIPFESPEDGSGRHVDTSCLFLLFGAFHALPRWGLMPRPMAMAGDRYFLKSLRDDGLSEARTGAPTLNYLCTWADVYRAVGETPPPYAKSALPAARLGEWLGRLSSQDFDIVQRLSGCRVSASCAVAAQIGA